MCSEERVPPAEQTEKDDSGRPNIHGCGLIGAFQEDLRSPETRSASTRGILMAPAEEISRDCCG